MCSLGFTQPVTCSTWTLWKPSRWLAPRQLPKQQMPRWAVTLDRRPPWSSSRWRHRASRWPIASGGKSCFPVDPRWRKCSLPGFSLIYRINTIYSTFAFIFFPEFSSGDITPWTVLPSAVSTQRTEGRKSQQFEGDVIQISKLTRNLQLPCIMLHCFQCMEVFCFSYFVVACKHDSQVDFCFCRHAGCSNCISLSSSSACVSVHVWVCVLSLFLYLDSRWTNSDNTAVK